MPPSTHQTAPSLLETPDLRTAQIATVALLKPIDKTYSYRIPVELEGSLRPGMRVRVPLGRNERAEPAFCVSVSRQPWDSTLKAVLGLIDDRPVLSEQLLALGQWVARYYCAHLGRTLDLMVPAAAKRQAGTKTVRYVTLSDPQHEPVAPAHGIVGYEPVAPATGITLRNRTNGRGLSTRQAAVLAAVRTANGRIEATELCQRTGCTPATLAALARRDLIRIESARESILPDLSVAQREDPNYELNPEQKAAINQIATAVAARRFSVEVLFGVTGSGKTEVYVATMRQALAEGRQAILLVPEIALTTQTVRRLQARFDRVAVIHSALSGVQRSRTWAAVASGAIPVVIGTRSAVFAPCPYLGVIIVDEESEPSYKSQASPRYHTRDVAITRAHLEGIPVVLGSAAPSLETWKNVQAKKHYHLIRLPRRVRDLPLPTVHLVDMRDEHKSRRGVHLLSRAMEWHLARCLDRNEQAVLLLNRRGYASFLHCPRCGTVISCPHCSVRMVFHATTELAHCHYCHARLAVPGRCQMAGCGGPLVRFGIGTQRVEEELKTKFPSARVRRMDADVMIKESDYADLIGAFEEREFDFLVGTQMIAKGLDFPFVSFVGVVSADTALALDDFRSEERTFQLVLQVAGRSGRGEVGGHVVVQSFAADTDAIQHAVKQDYEAFATRELANRKDAKLPPHTRMMRVILADARTTMLQKEARALADRIPETLEKQGIKARLFGPQPCAIARLRDQYRYDVQLSFTSADAMLRAVDWFKTEGTLKAAVKSLVVDVDPISLQ